jgi:alpha-L-arabinofuranosidase
MTAREWKVKLNALSGDEKGGFKSIIMHYDNYVSYLERTVKTDEYGRPIEGTTVQER